MKTQINIQIYRALKLGTRDEYLEGFLVGNDKIAYYEPEYEEGTAIRHQFYSNGACEETYGKGWFTEYVYKIDPAALAIHFPFYLIYDLFFGLENGKGASIIEAVFNDNNGTPFKGYAMCNSNGHVFYDKNTDWVSISQLKDIKVTGIQS